MIMVPASAKSMILAEGSESEINLYVGFLTILQIGLQAITKLPKVRCFVHPLASRPFLLFDFPPPSSTHLWTPQWLILNFCLFSLLIHRVFLICFSIPLLRCLSPPYIASPKWGTNHYGLTTLHAFPLPLESQGIIIPFEDSLETCSKRQIPFDSEFPQGTINPQPPTWLYSLLIQIPLSSVGVN